DVRGVYSGDRVLVPLRAGAGFVADDPGEYHDVCSCAGDPCAEAAAWVIWICVRGRPAGRGALGGTRREYVHVGLSAPSMAQTVPPRAPRPTGPHFRCQYSACRPVRLDSCGRATML